MKSLQGHLLVASQSMLDSNFAGTVVLLLQHSEQGALGLILNKPTKTPIRKIWEQVFEASCELDDPILVGGPVEGTLMAVHEQEALGDGEVIPGVYYTADRDNLESLVVNEDIRVRVFLGYAGWAAQQLENELKNGDWETLPAKVEHVFQNDDDLWEHIWKEIAGSSFLTSLRVKNFPEDPTVN